MRDGETVHESLNNIVAKVTHIWPYSKLFNPDAQPCSDERESDAWDELRDLTFNEDRDCIAVVTHSVYTDENDDFLNRLRKEVVTTNRVKFYSTRDIEVEIFHPSVETHTIKALKCARSTTVWRRISVDTRGVRG